VRSGIAQYNNELLPGLASAYSVELFVDAHPDQFVRPDAPMPLYNAHDFVWKHLRQPYDLIVYQLGNARATTTCGPTWPDIRGSWFSTMVSCTTRADAGYSSKAGRRLPK
jgi:hypothetical protein